MLTRITLALVLCSTFFHARVAAQDCQPPQIVANARSANLFTPEQEMILGELTVQRMSGETRFVRDERLAAYVNEIGARLAKHLPATGLRFRFHLIEMPEANAFNIPGGHVFVSRKLVAAAANEDELAGVIAHELGHAVVRHGATDISEAMRKILGVAALGDRKDIADKYNLLIERARTKRLARRGGHENEQQLEADRIGLYAMVAAGYDPAAFSSFFDRITETDGKTGGWLANLFGSLRPEQKRLREMIAATERMPQACREGRRARATEEFLKWQAEVVSYREASRKEALPGLIWKRELAPKLRGDVSHLAFNPDGSLLLAQDDFGITVLRREPLGVLFQIPVADADEAFFTSDGKQIVFTTENMRFERWSVAEAKPVEVRELVLRRDCWESKLSPDGDRLACVDTSTTVNLLDTKTGKKVWEKKEFYRLTAFEFFAWLASRRGGGEGDRGTNFFRIEFSPDSRYVVFSRSDKYRFRFTSDYYSAASENAALALDTTTLKIVETGGELKRIAARPYVFLDAEKIVGMPTRKPDEAGVFSFPGGKRLQKFALAAREIERTSNPRYVVVKPLSNAQMGVFDVEKGALATGLNKRDAALWNNLMAYESVAGKLLIREVSYNEAEKRFDGKDAGTAEIPVGPVGDLAAAEVSNNFGWLLLSSRTRGGLWNLATGERKLYVRGFKGAVVADDGGGVVDFPALGDTRRSLALMNPHAESVAAVRELPDRGARQYGRFVLLTSSLKQKPAEQKNDKPNAPDDDAEEPDLRRDVRFELKDFVQDKIVWSRDFTGEAPQHSFDASSGRLIFYWRLGGDAGKAKLKETPELQARAGALGDKTDDYLVEIVDAFARRAVGALLVETGKGSFDVGKGLSESDWLVLRDSENRVLVYSIKDGELRHRFFGGDAAINPRRNLIAVENLPGEVSLYDLATGERRTDFVIDGDAALVRFDLGGDRLFVFSAAQSAYAFDLNKIPAQATAQAR